MRKQSNFLVIVVLFVGSGAIYPCPKNINLLPKYGRAKKCTGQLAADSKLIAQVEQQHGSRQQGAVVFVKLGWHYLTINQVGTAMHRFNQAWLLDSLNAQVDWGFATALRMRGENKASLHFFKVAIARNKTHNKVWRDAALSYGNVWEETKEIAYLDTAVAYLKKSILLDNKQAYVYADLAHAYYYHQQADSAKKYLLIADKINSNMVDEEIRKLIYNK